jgi:hypothetical protein
MRPAHPSNSRSPAQHRVRRRGGFTCLWWHRRPACASERRSALPCLRPAASGRLAEARAAHRTCLNRFMSARSLLRACRPAAGRSHGRRGRYRTHRRDACATKTKTRPHIPRSQHITRLLRRAACSVVTTPRTSAIPPPPQSPTIAAVRLALPA